VKFAGDEVVFTNELSIIYHVELFAGRQLLAADAADEAFEMVDGLTCTTHEIVRRDALSAASALGAETSAIMQRIISLHRRCNIISYLSVFHTQLQYLWLWAERARRDAKFTPRDIRILGFSAISDTRAI